MRIESQNITELWGMRYCSYRVWIMDGQIPVSLIEVVKHNGQVSVLECGGFMAPSKKTYLNYLPLVGL